MARCDQGYLCDVCHEEVDVIRDSDLYLSFIIGLVPARSLLNRPERHIRCNPVQAQFIVADDFEPVVVAGPFGKTHLDPEDVRRQEELVTRGWRRLQEVSGLVGSIPFIEYPLPEVRERLIAEEDLHERHRSAHRGMEQR
jgi:hypothetical protein